MFSCERIQYLHPRFFWHNSRQWNKASSFTLFLDHTQRYTTFGRTPLDEWSGLRRDLYLTTHNIHNRQTHMFPVGFEPTNSAGERPQTHALDRAATIYTQRKYLKKTIFLCILICRLLVRRRWHKNIWIPKRKKALHSILSYNSCSSSKEGTHFLHEKDSNSCYEMHQTYCNKINQTVLIWLKKFKLTEVFVTH